MWQKRREEDHYHGPVIRARNLILDYMEPLRDCRVVVAHFRNIETGEKIVFSFTEGEMIRAREKKGRSGFSTTSKRIES